MHAKTWQVSVYLSERDGHTEARAVLVTGEEPRLEGHGSARRNPADPEVPEIGDELATARALSDLAHALLDAAVRDIEAVTHEPAMLPG